MFLSSSSWPAGFRPSNSNTVSESGRLTSLLSSRYGVSPSVAGSVPLSSEEADIFDGQERIHSTLCCSPALVKHVSDQLKDESMIAKEARKAREEKAMAQHQRLSPTPPATQGADELATPSWPSTSAETTKKKKKGGKGGGGGGQG